MFRREFFAVRPRFARLDLGPAFFQETQNEGTQMVDRVSFVRTRLDGANFTLFHQPFLKTAPPALSSTNPLCSARLPWRFRKMTTDVKRIAQNTGYSVETIQAIKSFIFLELHDLGEGRIAHFDVSFEMAESWQRLMGRINAVKIHSHDA